MFRYMSVALVTMAVLMSGMAASANPKAAKIAKEPAKKEQVASRGLFLALLAPLAGKVIERVAVSVFDSQFKDTNDSNLPADAFFGNVSFKDGSVNSAKLAGKDAKDVYGGLAFEVLIADGEGNLKAVDPATYGFVTGDKFHVRFMSNLPGQVSAYNINSEGREMHLGAWSVAQGQTVQLPVSGSFQFQGVAGNEQLRLELTPCETSARSRDVVIAAAGPGVGNMLGKCGSAAVATREISEVNVTENTGFALSPVTEDEKNRHRLDARTVTLNFQHRRPEVKEDARRWLVTPEEAAPPTKARTMLTTQSDPGGPKVVIRSPGEVKEVKAPVSIEVQFQAQGQAPVDINSLKVTYIGLFDVDITDRLIPYLTNSGIKAEDADLPPGNHVIDIAVRDKDGKRTVERLFFKVLQ